MAIIYSYPQVSSALQDDRLIITRIDEEEDEITTKQLTLGQIADYVITTNDVVTGTGTPNYLPIWGAGGDSIVDSQLKQVGPTANGLYQIKLDNTDRFIINKPSSTTSGDPEYLIQQDGEFKVSFGWDDDGAGFGYLYNWAGDGWRFGSAGNNPELTITTTSGSEGVEIANNLTVGANATITGTLNTRILEVSNGVNANQIRVQTSNSDYRPGLIIGSNTYVGARIKLEHTDDNPSEWDAFILSRDGAVSIGRVDGVSTNNLNIKKDNGYVGIKQTAPLAPLHVKGNGEAIRLESTGGNPCSIDFRQGTDKKGHIQFENENDTLAIQTQNPSGGTSKIKFSIAERDGAPEEVMRIQSSNGNAKQVVIGNPIYFTSSRALYVHGGIETVGDLFVNAKASISGRCDADSYKLKGLNTPPATATSDGVLGEIRYTEDYIYVCVQNGVWKRTALTTW